MIGNVRGEGKAQNPNEKLFDPTLELDLDFIAWLGLGHLDLDQT